MALWSVLSSRIFRTERVAKWINISFHKIVQNRVTVWFRTISRIETLRKRVVNAVFNRRPVSRVIPARLGTVVNKRSRTYLWQFREISFEPRRGSFHVPPSTRQWFRSASETSFVVVVVVVVASLTGLADVVEIPVQFLENGENSSRHGEANGDNIAQKEHRVPP